MSRLWTFYVERLATAKGRLSRLQFLKYQLLLFAIWMVVTIPIVLLWVNLAGESTGWLLPLVLLVPGSFMIYANVAIMVRRFHDFDFNGWWVLAYVIAGAIAGAILETATKELDKNDSSLSLILAALEVIVVLSIYVVPGTLGTNKYGDVYVNASSARVPESST